MDEQPVETTLYSLAPMAPEPQQRGTGEQQLSLLRVGSLTIGDRRELCLIKNVSVGGMLIRAYSKIQPGMRLSIELKHGESVSGVATWVEDECVGVSFDAPVDVLDLISSSMDGPRPRMPRIEVCCTAWVREGAAIHRARATNVSQGGAKLETDKDLPVGADVVVTLSGLAPIAGVIRWNEGRAYGITFNRVLALSELVGWLHQQQEQQRAAG